MPRPIRRSEPIDLTPCLPGTRGQAVTRPRPAGPDRRAVPADHGSLRRRHRCPALDAVGHVPWLPPEYNEVTLHRILVHTIAEAHRHAGHADIVRELVDGSAGMLDGD